MENARYRIEIEFSPQTVNVPADASADHDAKRVALFLPDGAQVTAARVDPAANLVATTIELSAPTPADALITVTRALEDFAMNVRREHHAPPLGPAPVMHRVTITHASEPPGAGPLQAR
jgi:hypothetical protein